MPIKRVKIKVSKTFDREKQIIAKNTGSTVLDRAVLYLRMSYLGWENLVPLEIEDFWLFFLEIHFLRLKGSFFRFFGNFSK